MSDEKFDESKRIKPMARMKRVKVYAKGWALALVVGGGAVALAHASGAGAEKVAIYALVAALLEEPIAWLSFAMTDRAVQQQQEAESRGDATSFGQIYTAKTAVATALLVFVIFVWLPLRWGIVYATALGWL